MTAKEYKEAMQTAGYREKYALENGTVQLVTVNDEKCYRFTYPTENEYQDANGAIYNTKRKEWVK